jgi:hypothetical protein
MQLNVVLCFSSSSFSRNTNSNSTLDFEVPFQKAASAVELSVNIKISDLLLNEALEGFNKIIQLPPIGGSLLHDFRAPLSTFVANTSVNLNGYSQMRLQNHKTVNEVKRRTNVHG